MKTFEQFLEDEIWCGDGILDDEMPDAFSNWISELDGEDYLEYAGQYGEYVRKETLKNIREYIISEEVKKF